jgi:hypothetical protein
MGSDVSEYTATEVHDAMSAQELASQLMLGQLRATSLAPLLRSLLARIEALEARNYRYDAELDTVLLRIRDDYHSTDH